MNKEIYLYSYQDLKSNIYDVPFWAKNDVHAKRKFYMDVVSGNGNHVLGKFTVDFRLVKLGKFDVEKGEVKRIEKDVIIEGVDLKIQIKGDKDNEISNEAPIF